MSEQLPGESKRGFLRALAVLLLLTVVLGAFVIQRARSLAERETAILVRVDALQERLEGRESLRDAAWGDGTDSLAWEHYEQAIAALESKVEDASVGDVFMRALHADDDASRTARNALLTEHSTVLQHLRRGAQARDTRREIDWTRGFDQPSERLLNLRWVTFLAVAEARRSSEVGDDLEAVRTLLDTTQLGRDLAQSPILIEGMIGYALLVPEGVTDWLGSGGASDLSDDAKREFLAGLRRIEATLAPELTGLLGEDLLAARMLHSIAEGDGWEDLGISRPYGIGSLLNAWDPDREWVSHLEQRFDAMERLEAAQARGDAELLLAAEAREAEVANSDSEFTRMLGAYTSSAVRSRLRARLHLAMLRHALAIDLGDATDPLPTSPFGAAVDVDTTGGSVRISTQIDAHDSLEIVLR